MVNSAINATEPIIFAELMTRRLQLAKTAAQMKQYDASMDRRFRKRRAVFTIQIHDQEKTLVERGVVRYIESVLRMKSVTRSECDSRRGQRVQSIATKIWGQTFCLFETAKDALEAAIGSMKAWRHEKMDCRLMAGLGYGDVLDLDGGDCFGDPVNMAFKLGEDTAKDGEILIDKPFWDRVKEECRSVHLATTDFKLEPRSVSMSGVTIPHFCVKWE